VEEAKEFFFSNKLPDRDDFLSVVAKSIGGSVRFKQGDYFVLVCKIDRTSSHELFAQDEGGQLDDGNKVQHDEQSIL
jgi:hypothetical protein